MARLYKRGRIWWCWYWQEGKQVRRSTRCTDRQAADRVARQLERAAAEPRLAAAQSVTVETALVRFLEVARQRGERSEATHRFYRTKAIAVAATLGHDTTLAEIDARAIDDYISTRLEEVSRHTVAHELGVIRQMLRVARRRGEYHLATDEVLPEQFDRGYTPRRDFVTKDEMDRILAATALEDRRAHLAFLAATGASWGPSTRAQRDDIDLDVGLILVRGTKRPSRYREVPILDHTQLWAEMARDGAKETGLAYRPWGNIRHDLAATCRRAGVTVATPNTIRHSFGEWLREMGISTDLIGATMGHTDSRMVERVYTHLDGARLAKAIRHQLERRSVIDV